ncbi:Asp-tRNA(Asn)/Glu-tRNA(Gln) amidotransferase subunit GatA [Aerococcus sanguinicola]|uniref:Asp-tRNA(Asn)/Glu-tRNA(Gln) amidotransferase subunit GatA n=1 Tax=unclassified Aerococcus TaxID=2618060 RepID=UPI0008A334A7|nr:MULTISPECIES: Asp-tRNA(Asn)/Glu-tRNA(Gln) amidotransferase subunit GatA [unclassified Aerococcus]MDK6233334.1 Asp-tRNA(Asn)/Glu-tRNA(Gln) amidotransferase subunit GatA [Aerococcus sp. UMB10185]MDK6855163.1 Asp-tRNA(Asn)/Glu-tRNA(Gln) amidotransferase subunit GatA [Aerococcus sp. UMB7533]MDK8501923.1 Asp-tRNA(Asn)/Glu-tRNA(Gln) amidotransferase subunit GatA [Aerococcus sp. UMB1112A]OFN04345.1 aspartyl/glutamyl-tRNA amidotransferase subunit A [Aerococcus sp. HMSC062A02]OHO42926.1 aspartyl/glu
MSKRFEETIRGLNQQLVDGDITAVELVEETIARIKDLDETYNAFITLNEEAALEAAKASDEAGYSTDRPLQGIPLGIKDNIVTENLRTTAASRMLENFVPVYNSTVCDRLEAAGAIIIGKLNMDEFAMGGSTETSYFGQTRNPWDTDRVPGGSSGGSAAAVAGGEVVAALGSDTGGSIRQPAAFTGIVGLKPTYGLVSRWGLIAFGSSFDQIGPMTRTVEDNAIILEAIAGHDDHDSTTADLTVPKYSQNLDDGIEGLKVAVPKEFFAEGVDEKVQENVRQAIAKLEELGAIVEEVSIPHLKYGIPAYYILASSEASSNLQRFDGVRYGYRAENVKDLEDLYVRTRSEGFGSEVKMRIMLGTFALSSGYFDAYFNKAGKVRYLLRQELASVFEKYDVIAGPVSTTPAYKLGERVDDPLQMYMADLLTVPVNLAGLPGMSVPAGFDEDGLPIGLQLIGNYFDESTLYKTAYAFEQATDYQSKHPE